MHPYPILIALWGGLITGSQAADSDPLALRAKAILQQHCYRCHGAKGAVEGGFSYLLERDQLVHRKLIVPGDAANSRLLQRIQNGEMPPKDEKARPSAEDSAALAAWIKAGAASLRPAEKRDFITNEKILEIIWQDLQKLPEFDRRFMRYFSLVPQYNTGAAAEELESGRQAVSKLVNSVSWGPRVVAPVAIGDAGVLLRVDMRDYKWTARTWSLIGGSHRYEVHSKSELEKKCGDAMQTDRLFVRGDWFANFAAGPITYSLVLQLPAGTAELERLLGVDLNRDIESEQVARAGFNDSMVTPFGRMIERHESNFGALWVAYTYLDKKALFEQPLALPVPKLREAWQPTRQVMFHLPNGMMAYAVWDSHFASRDTARHIYDVRRPDAQVQAPLACMSCHTSGLIARTDQLQAHVAQVQPALPKATRDKIDALYPSERRMAKLIAEDTERFHEALKLAGCSTSGADPIVALVVRHHRDLDLKTAAAELGLTESEFTARLDKIANAKVRAIVQRGVIKRAEFESMFGGLVQNFGLGTIPVRTEIANSHRLFITNCCSRRAAPCRNL